MATAGSEAGDMSSSTSRVVICLLVILPAIANAVPPPYDASKQLPKNTVARAIGLIAADEDESAFSVLEEALARDPGVGDVDYAIGWAMWLAARNCRLDRALKYYTWLRRDFSGHVGRGANGAHRRWEQRMHIARAYVTLCDARTASGVAEKMRLADRWLPRLPAQQRYVNARYANWLEPDFGRNPQPRGLRHVTVVAAWRFAHAKGAWIRLPRFDEFKFVDTSYAAHWSIEAIVEQFDERGLYGLVWHSNDRMRVSKVRKGAVDCEYYGGRDGLAESRPGRPRSRAGRYQCTPRGLEFVPDFEVSVGLYRKPLMLDAAKRFLATQERNAPLCSPTVLGYRNQDSSGLSLVLQTEWERSVRIQVHSVRIRKRGAARGADIFLPGQPRVGEVRSQPSTENRRRAVFWRAWEPLPLADLLNISLEPGNYEIELSIDGEVRRVVVRRTRSSATLWTSS